MDKLDYDGLCHAQKEIIDYLYRITDGDFGEGLSAENLNNLLQEIYNLSVCYELNIYDGNDRVSSSVYYDYDTAINEYNNLGRIDKELVEFDDMTIDNDIIYSYWIDNESDPKLANTNTLTIKRGE